MGGRVLAALGSTAAHPTAFRAPVRIPNLSRMSPAQPRLPHGPIRDFLGLEVLELEEGSATVRLEPRPEFLQEKGIVQGGLLSALADAAAVYGILPGLPEGKSVTSIEFKVNFLRPGRLDAGPITARSNVIRQGRTVALSRVRLLQGERELMDGLFTYLVFDEDE